MKKNHTLSLLRIIAGAVVLIGALSSLNLMFNTGRNQKSILLIALFTIWVLSPFVALIIGIVVSNRWAASTRLILYCLGLLLTIGSFMMYSGRLSVAGTKPAFVFLIVPLISWLVIAIIIPISRSASRRNRMSS